MSACGIKAVEAPHEPASAVESHRDSSGIRWAIQTQRDIAARTRGKDITNCLDCWSPWAIRRTLRDLCTCLLDGNIRQRELTPARFDEWAQARMHEDHL
jgi:hypothetical protein